MKSETQLDYAVFQLTPTRTRCELLISADGATEKLASGLLQPFLDHLKAADDLLSKGGWSIRLEPPRNSDWFTKGTIERFVKFVSFPELLERVSTVHTELSQLLETASDSSRSDDQTTTPISRLVETVGNISNESLSLNEEKQRSDAQSDDNSRSQLQKATEARRILLQKEEKIAFARAMAAGFVMETLPNLIHFSAHFGASRLQEACEKYMNICRKKHDTEIWLEEIKSSLHEGEPLAEKNQTVGEICCPLAADEASIVEEKTCGPVAADGASKVEGKICAGSSIVEEQICAADEASIVGEKLCAADGAFIVGGKSENVEKEQQTSPLRRIRAAVKRIMKPEDVEQQKKEKMNEGEGKGEGEKMNEGEGEGGGGGVKEGKRRVSSVKAAISMFESKASSSSGSGVENDERRRMSVGINRMGTEKAVLRRWSAAASELALPESIDESKSMGKPTGTTSSSSSEEVLVEEKMESSSEVRVDLPSAAVDGVSVDDVDEGKSVLLCESEIVVSAAAPVEYDVQQLVRIAERSEDDDEVKNVGGGGDDGDDVDGDGDEKKKKLMKKKPLVVKEEERRGRLYDEYREKRDAAKIGLKKGERDAKLRSMQDILEKRKAEVNRGVKSNPVADVQMRAEKIRAFKLSLIGSRKVEDVRVQRISSPKSPSSSTPRQQHQYQSKSNAPSSSSSSAVPAAASKVNKIMKHSNGSSSSSTLTSSLKSSSSSSNPNKLGQVDANVKTASVVLRKSSSEVRRSQPEVVVGGGGGGAAGSLIRKSFERFKSSKYGMKAGDGTEVEQQQPVLIRAPVTRDEQSARS